MRLMVEMLRIYSLNKILSSKLMSLTVYPVRFNEYHRDY